MRWPVTTGPCRHYKLSVEFRYYRRCHWLIRIFSVKGLLWNLQIWFTQQIFYMHQLSCLDWKTQSFMLQAHENVTLTNVIEYDLLMWWVCLLIGCEFSYKQCFVRSLYSIKHILSFCAISLNNLKCVVCHSLFNSTSQWYVC